MREIKFRAWDKTEKEMQVVTDIFFDKRAGFLKSFLTKGSKATYSTNEDYHEIMQYTGLKDKNGVEIYEGDIVKYTVQRIVSGFFVEENHIGEVVYEMGCYEVKYELLIDLMNEDDELEIIGNIYENKNLLEDNS